MTKVQQVSPFLTHVYVQPGSAYEDTQDKEKVSNQEPILIGADEPCAVLLGVEERAFEKELEAFKKLTEEMKVISSVKSLLDCDLQTYMPSQASDDRAWQMSYLTKCYYEVVTSQKMADLLKYLQDEVNLKKLNRLERILVREVGIEHEKLKKIPSNLVQEFTEVTSKAHHVWKKARATKRFDKFKPYLEKIFSIRCQMAECIGYKGSPYNAFLDMYEEEITTEELDKIFTKLKKELVPIVKTINNSTFKPDTSYLDREFSKEELKGGLRKRLKELSVDLLKQIHFDFSRGRLDKSAHPFSMLITKNDTRLTTRYKTLRDVISTIMHEGGHGLYDQGVDPELAKTPLSELTSLGVHESQSRLYEIMVGQGLPFWKYYYPKLQERFPEQLKNVSLEDFYKAMNAVKAIFIRNESDEVTYNLHGIVRYETEKDRIEGRLQVQDIPKVWNQKMQEYLGITPPNDALGCLQDVHWACGDIGYFPTYTLGDLYKIQFFNQAKKEIPNLEEEIAKGNQMVLREWLREKIHKYGRTETPREIIERVTGRPFNVDQLVDDYIKYIKDKYGEIYGISNWG